jgi:hypothetical protein
MNKEDQKTYVAEIDVFIDKMEKLVQTHDTQEMIVKTVYKIHKPLKDLRHIRSSREVQECLYNLRFMMIYDKEDFIDIIVMLEYFLKIHFNVMIGKYDIQTYFVILKDIRKEVINALYSSFFNVPEYSTTFYSKNLQGDMRHETTKLQAITFKYLKVASHKYRSDLSHDTYKGTVGIDASREINYDMLY